MTTITTTTSTATSLVPLLMHLPPNPPAVQTQPDSPTTSPLALEHALLAAEERLLDGNERMLATLLDLQVNIGQQLHALKDEKARLQAEISLKQRHIETLELLHQEKWPAHLEAARVRMKPLAEAIAEFVRSFREFKISFPGEAISQIQESAVPNHEWVTTLGSFVNGCPAKYPLPPKAEVAHQAICVTTDQTLVVAAPLPQAAPHMRQLHSLEEDRDKLKGDLTVVEARSQQLVKHNTQTIDSWNRVFEPYRNRACLFQAKIASFLQQQHSSLFQLAKEISIIDTKLPAGPNCHPKYYGHPVMWQLLPRGGHELLRKVEFPGENMEIVKRIDKASPLQKQIDAIVPLIEGMMFKQPVNEVPPS